MIEGVVDELGLPTITLRIASRDWIAIIDTGFNGDLELPYALGPAVQARYLTRIRSALAAGQIVEEDAYQVQFPFDDALVSAEATFTQDDTILIGTRLLRHHRLEVDFERRTVRVERSTPQI